MGAFWVLCGEFSDGTIWYFYGPDKDVILTRYVLRGGPGRYQLRQLKLA